MTRHDGYCARCGPVQWLWDDHACWPATLARNLMTAAVGCAGFEAGLYEGESMLISARPQPWFPGCNIPRPSTPIAEGAVFVPWPADQPTRYNACTEPCGMWTGPCSCGAWHWGGM